MDQTPHPLYDADKSWTKAKKIAEAMVTEAQLIEKHMNAVIRGGNKIADMATELFIATPKVDTKLMVDSPIYPAKLIISLYKHMARVDEEYKLHRFAWLAKANPIDIYKAPRFSEAVKEAVGWALKFEHWKETKKDAVESLI